MAAHLESLATFYVDYVDKICFFLSLSLSFKPLNKQNDFEKSYDNDEELEDSVLFLRLFG